MSAACGAGTAAPAGADAALIERGRYLAAAGDCVSCHTRAHGAAFTGGRPLNTPFGLIYSANITPDAVSGIGSWSEQQFARALREGIAADGKHLYPAFPYPEYTKVSDSDVHAIYLYFRSLTPVRYTPPPNAMMFPFGNRALIAGWNMMFFTPGRFVEDTARSAQWNRGAYLTQGLGHCGACHTPRNVLGAERNARAFGGGVYLDEIADEVLEDKITPMDEVTVRPWSTADLTRSSSGLGAWSVEELAAYLKTGHNARAGAFGPMSEVIANSTRHLSDADNLAIAVYLKSLTPAARPAVDEPGNDRRKAGEIVYTARCGDCHLPTGLGMPRGPNTPAAKAAPPLAGNAMLQAENPATLINIILYGAHGGALAAEPANAWPWPRMSGFELSVGLDDASIADLCTYVRSSWGNHAPAVSAADVAKQH
jgi:mono/diheme cytochrome c family protein